jgi:hypothetical protein
MNNRLEKYHELFISRISDARFRRYRSLLSQNSSDSGRSRHAGRDRKQSR